MTTITRRDIIKLASALGLAGAVPTADERIATAQMLDRKVSSRAILDPGNFARETHLSMSNDDPAFGNGWFGVICPKEAAENAQARERLDRLFRTHGINDYCEAGDYDAAAVSFNLAMYDAGVRHGAAYENLRRSLVGEVVQCSTCWGTGEHFDKDTGKVLHGRTCTTCGGTGTVAMKG